MIAAFLLFAVAQEPKITYECGATRLEPLLAKISPLAGQKLMASPATKDEFLVIHVADAPLNELMAKIAQAAAAEWVRESEGFRLIRSPKLLQEQDREHFKTFSAKIAGAQAKLREQLAADGAFDETKARSLSGQIDAMIQEARNNRGQPRNWETRQRLDRSLPGGRLAQTLAAALDPAVMATIEAPGRMVFSTEPNRMQSALPKEAWNAIRAYVAERDRLKPFLPTIGDADSEGIPYSLWAVRNAQGLSDQAPAKVLVQASRWESGSGISIQVWIANQAGQVLDNSSISLSTESFSGPMPAPPDPDPSGAKPLPISDRSQALADALKAAMARGGDPSTMPPLPSEIKSSLLQPEEHNISEFILSDLLLGTARAKDLNVVAGVTDIAGLFTVVQFGGGSPSANQFLTKMRGPQYDTAVEETPGWLVMRPLDPYVDRARRVDRAALGRLVRAAAKGKVSIEEAAAFAAGTPDGFDRTPVMVYMMLTEPRVLRTIERSSFQILKFHGMLTLGQRQSMASGVKLPYAQMTPAQKRIFHRLVFMEQDGLSRTTRMAGPQAAPAEEFHGETLKWQPTERFPNGVPPNGTVSLEYKEGPIIAASGTSGQYRTSGEFDVAQIAYDIWARENPAGGNPDQRANYNEFSYIEQRSFRYNFAPDESMSFGGELKEETSRSKTVTSPDQLPPDVWARIKAEIESIRKRQRPPSGGGGGGGR